MVRPKGFIQSEMPIFYVSINQSVKKEYLMLATQRQVIVGNYRLVIENDHLHKHLQI